MITLAIAAAFFYLTLQNWPIFNGFAGFTTIPAPIAFCTTGNIRPRFTV